MLHNRSTLHGMAAILTAFTLGGCASASPSYSGSVSPESLPLVVDVQNLNWWDMEVELDAEGTRFRLGVAPSYGRVRFQVSASRLGGASYFRLIANPMDTGREAFSSVTGQGVAVTPVIELLDHRSVHWTVGASETTTNLIVR
jgi:hypothetical protein